MYMLSNIDVVRLIKSHFADKGEPLEVYPKAFPLDTADVSATVDVFSPSPMRNGLFNLIVSVNLRAKHPSVAESKINELNAFLEGLHGIDIGQTHLLYSKSLNPYPNYLGVRANGYHQYSAEYDFLLDWTR